MRGTISLLLGCLLLAGGVMHDVANAATRRTQARKTTDGRPGKDKAYSLDDIMTSPKEYMDREVMFYARFATTANLFKSVNTRFNSTSHVNVAVWPDKALLWESKGRKNVLPTLYINKSDQEVLDVLRQLKKYELIAITGEVYNVYAGYPWILITNIERIEKPYDRLCEQVIEHMQAGHEALKAEHGGAAARHFEQALQFGLPTEFRAKAYEQLAQAFLLENKLDRARGYLRQAVEVDGTDPILHLALADVALRMGDAGEALAHSAIALERSGRYPQVYGIRAEAQSLLGEFGKAFEDLNTAAGTPGITPREKAMISVRRARIYTRAERYIDAARVYAAVSEPGEPLGAESWLHNEIGLFYEKLYLESDDARYLDSAFAAFSEAARLSRLDPALLFNMAEVEYRRQRLSETPDYSKVTELIQKIYELEPDFAAARILEGRVLFIEGNMEEAEFRYQSVANQIGQDPIALLTLGEAYMELGYYDEAAATVARARMLQPWNCRVQALGQFLEETAQQMAMAEAEYYDSWRHEALRDKRFYHDGGRAMNPERAAPSRKAPQASEVYEDGSEGETYYEQDSSDYQEARMGGRRNGRPLRQAARNNGPRPEEYNRPNQQRMRPQGSPAPANAFAARDAQNGGYRFDARKMLRPNPASNFGVSSSGLINHGMVQRQQPQDIQTFVRPNLPPEERKNRFPTTRVRLPERDRPMARPSKGGETGYHEYDSDERGISENEEGVMNQNRRGNSVEPLDLGYTPGGTGLLDLRPANDGENSGAFDENFGKDYDWNENQLRGAEVDEDGFLRFGMIEGVRNAYASLAVPEVDEQTESDAENVRIPQAFSFAPDNSPVIIADIRSPGGQGRDMPIRNANVYRKLAGTRRPAEILERESIESRLPTDASAMVPPAGGGVRKAEVRLPSSSRGVGMSSDYSPDGR